MAMARVLLVFSSLYLAAAKGTSKDQEKWMEENKKREGVTVYQFDLHELQYKVIKEGHGKLAPGMKTTVRVHYYGTTLAMTPDLLEKEPHEWNAFDSSHAHGMPLEVTPTDVIRGWGLALEKMVEGDIWEVYIPSELGYGDQGSGEDIKPGDVLIFRMELVELIDDGSAKRGKPCNFKTREDCLPGESDLLDKWADKSADEIKKEITRMELRKARPMNTKNREREAHSISLKLLLQLRKMKQNDEL